MAQKEQMNIVVVGHVDHGKSTVIGRLMADTGSLPQGKLEQVKKTCENNARPFEYAFLLDALKDEQAQGITIDTCRCFFKTKLRDYIIIDAPGHVEFLKNMVTGAARAEAALLVIDANEGIQENSRRHGYMLSMLGINQIVVLVNKMDLVNYDICVFDRIREDYSAFLGEIGVRPIDFIPICAREGENIVSHASWYQGKTVLEHIDAFVKERESEKKPFRFPLQDVYKFTANNDDRRICAGTIESGSIKLGDPVVFYPSGKTSRCKTIENFNRPPASEASYGQSVGFTLHDELYIRPGELMVKADEAPPHFGNRFRANLFWMGKAPMLKNKRYKLKLAAARSHVVLSDIIKVLDASELTASTTKTQVDRHDVAECILETAKPIAFDLTSDIESTGRFVIVDNYEIAGGGIILEQVSDNRSTLKDHIEHREASWERSSITSSERELVYSHKAKFVVITGGTEDLCKSVGTTLERRLFNERYKTYYLGLANIDYGLDSDVLDLFDRKEERIRRLGELARIMTDSGQIFITTVSEADEHELELLRQLNAPHEVLVVSLEDRPDLEQTIARILALLREEKIIADFVI